MNDFPGTYAIDRRDVLRAAARIVGQVHRTPVVTCSTLDALAGREIFFKCENLQRVGAFKFRGASNAVLSLDEASASRGVVTHSSGNHAQAVALAARLRGVAATIVMPSNAPAVKRRAVAGYGARIVECEPTQQARENTARAIVDELGATFIHPYDNADVIAGQGTAALELIEQVPGLDAVLVPVGGGGLMAGTATAVGGEVRAFGAEPAGADDAARSKACGQRLEQLAPNTIADGLRTSLGQRTWPIVRDRVEAIFTSEDEAIAETMHLFWERTKLIIEPSAAVPVAVALHCEAFRALEGVERVGIVLSGGNVDLGQLPWST